MYINPDMSDEENFDYNHEYALVNVTIKNGSEYSCKVENVARKGSKDNPLSRQERIDKFIDCTGGYFDLPRATSAIEMLENLENIRNIKELLELL